MAWMRSRKGALAFVAMFAVVAWAKPMGLLLWARLRILTSIPKTAIADDPAKAPAEEQPALELDSGLSPQGARLIDPFSIDPPQAKISCTTRPETSVRRKSRPA